MKTLKLITLTLLFYSTLSCQQKQPKMEPLTQKHLATFLSMHYINTANLTPAELEQGRLRLIETYKDDPKGTLAMLDEHLENNSQLKAIFEKLNTPIWSAADSDSLTPKDKPIHKPAEVSKNTNTPQNLPQGFQEFRRILNYDDMSYFNNAKANELRAFFSNSRLFYEKVNSYGQVGGTSYSEVIIFCTDGTFSYQSSSMISADTGGASGYDGGKNVVTGYWDAFTQQGSLVVSLYSDQPAFIKDNPTGYMPLIIKNAQQNVVRVLWNGEDYLYRRSVISCN